MLLVGSHYKTLHDLNNTLPRNQSSLWFRLRIMVMVLIIIIIIITIINHGASNEEWVQNVLCVLKLGTWSLRQQTAAVATPWM